MSYSRETLRLFSDLLSDLAGSGDYMDLATRVLPHLRRLFSVQVTAVNYLPATEPVARVVAVTNMDLTHPSVQEFPRFAHENPALRFLLGGGRAPVLRISDFMSEGRFLDTGLYQEIYRPFDGRHQMSLMVPVAGEQWGFTLFRERAFSDDEAYLLAQLQGHVGRALAAAKGFAGNCMPGGATGRGAEAGVDGFIGLNAEGNPLHVTERAAGLLTKYFGPFRAGSLPEDLHRWVGVGLRIMRFLEMASLPGRQLLVPAVDGRLVVRLLRDREMGTPLLQLREESAGMDYLELQRVGLTRRECEVLFWVAQGKRDGEIATVLGMATKTVGKHLENILAKLGCETRTAAVRVAGEVLRACG